MNDGHSIEQQSHTIPNQVTCIIILFIYFIYLFFIQISSTAIINPIDPIGMNSLTQHRSRG